MSFLHSLDIAGSALAAQRTRMDIISQNIANQETYKTEDGTPYRRQLVVFEEQKSFEDYLTEKGGPKSRYEGVRIAKIVEDQSELVPIYDPSHPDADEDGYLYKPNVDNTKEQIDLLAATNSYNANVTALNAVKAISSKALEIFKA